MQSMHNSRVMSEYSSTMLGSILAGASCSYHDAAVQVVICLSPLPEPTK